MKRKSIAVLLSLSMLLQTTTAVNAHGTVSMNAVSMNEVFQNTVCEEETAEEKQYLVVANDKECYNELAKEIGEDVVAETMELEENNILVAELDANEVEELEQKEEVMIEEDIIISASSKKKPDTKKDSESAKKEQNQANKKKKQKQGDDNKDKPLSAEKTKEQVKKQKEELFNEKRETDEAAKEAESEWNLKAINADEAASEASTYASIAEGEGKGKVKVAVLDSGIDYVEGIELAGYINLVEEEQEIPFIFQDITGHGTGIASIIAANGEGDVQGVNPNADLYSVRVLDGENSAPLSRIIQGIYWCIENDIDIINMSFGTSVRSEAMQKAVKEAYDAGILMVAAAGNTSGAVEYPAAFDEVMAVAATNPEAELSDFSNTGEELDVAAPGESIRVSSFFNGNMVTHGTSIAVPHVTGVASLLWEQDLTKSNEFIRQLITQSAKEMEGTDDCGLLDAAYALEMYDEFEASYNDADTEAEIPKNMKEAEVFDEISDDEAYVEGRWVAIDHTNTVNAGNAWFTQEQINIIKAGAVYPDNDQDWAGSGQNPRWHGKWKSSRSSTHYVNYAAVYEMVTTIALEGGKVSAVSSAGEIMGMDQTTYTTLKKDIRDFVNDKAADVFANKPLKVANTAENRKYFLWGCALHSLTDIFAHSTARANGMVIGHHFDDTYPDTTTYYKRRYDTATKAAEYSLECLKNGVFGDGAEIVAALNEIYKGKASFKVIRVKKFLNANGYSASVLTEANIDEPLYP